MTEFLIGKDLKGSDRGLIVRSFSALFWRDCGKLLNKLRVAGSRVEI
jgi:hypothetical protein